MSQGRDRERGSPASGPGHRVRGQWFRWPLPAMLALAAGAGGELAATGRALDPATLHALWPEVRQIRKPPPCILPEEVISAVRRLEERYRPLLRVREVGRSSEHRPVLELQLGEGPERLLFWSQMHGDEPSATPALVDLAAYLLERRGDPEVERLLEDFTLVLVPMLNPDGAERYTRRNAWGIDINRDARRLATPEGRLLARLAEEHRPLLGFNLHDQNRRRTAGKTGVLASGSVLAVAGDEAGTRTPGRQLAMRAAVALVAAVEPWISGRMARFDDTWNPRAFGDTLTAAGFPVLLVESGGVLPGEPLAELARMNFIGLGAVLGGLVRDRLASIDLATYDDIPENESDLWVDGLVRDAEVWVPTRSGVDRFRADVGWNRLLGDREREGCGPPSRVRSRLVEVGDGGGLGSARRRNAEGRVLTPAFRVGLEGWGRRGWLAQRENLERLARLGVAEIVWKVEDRQHWRALEWLRGRSVTLSPRIVVTARSDELPQVIWRVRPPADRARSWTEVLLQFEKISERSFRPKSQEEVLALLWSSPAGSPLVPERPADLLLWTRGESDRLDRLEAVVLEGVEVLGQP